MAAPLSPEAIRLRQLVGLDVPEFEEDVRPAAPVRSVPQVPAPTELLALLEKQDAVIGDLYTELDLCKTELVSLKSHSMSVANETRRLFDEMKTQIAQQSVTVAEKCEKCAKESSVKLSSSNAAQITQHVVPENSTMEGAYEKVRVAVELAEQLRQNNAILQIELNETKGALQRLRTDHTTVVDEYSKQLKECQENAMQMYKNELDVARNEIQRLIASKEAISVEHESDKISLSNLTKERDELKTFLHSLESDTRQEIAKLTSELGATRLQVDKESAERTSTQQKLFVLQDSIAQKDASQKSMIEDLHADLQAIRQDHSLLMSRCAALTEENARLRTENIRYKSESARLNAQVDHLKFVSEETAKVTVEVARRNNDTKNAELERLLANQAQLISDLRLECVNLAKQMQSLQKNNSKEIKRLKNENKELVARLDNLIHVSSGTSEDL